MSKDKPSSKYRSRRSRILYLITILMVVIFVAFGLVTWFVYRGSQSRLVEKSKEKLLETEANNIITGGDYTIELLLPIFQEAMGDMSTEELAIAMMNREVIEAQMVFSREISKMMDMGMLGLDELIYVILPGGLVNEPIVLLSSDESLVYQWEPPEYMLEDIAEGTDYIYTEDGIPELGLEGKYLLVYNQIESENDTLDSVVLNIKNMDEEVAELDSYFSDEQGKINLIMGLVIFGSVILIILITFFVLSYLIRKRITEPVDELAAAADQVNEGNLEVEIMVHEGGEFEGLERAFKQMVESWRKLMDRVAGGE